MREQSIAAWENVRVHVAELEVQITLPQLLELRTDAQKDPETGDDVIDVLDTLYHLYRTMARLT